ncbi:MAG: response regulator transcription factor [Opitutales bacterium]
MTASNQIRILIVDDSKLVREGLKVVLDTAGRPALRVVGEAGSNAEAVAACARLKPDLALLDISLPDGPGFTACREMLRLHLSIRIIVLTAHTSHRLIHKAVMGDPATAPGW